MNKLYMHGKSLQEQSSKLDPLGTKKVIAVLVRTLQRGLLWADFHVNVLDVASFQEVYHFTLQSMREKN